MFDYENLRLIWWALLGVLLIGFAVMDGFDFGTGALLPFLGKNDDERRVMINTVGPVWEGNQVWLILGAGAVFAAWPYIYAVAFSGFYLAMFLVLCTLILRPVSIKFRSKMPNAGWRSFWDWCLFISGVVPPVIFGVAVGNALQGVPFTFDDTMRMTYSGSLLGLLNPFALLAGLVSLSMIVTQGAVWLAIKTDSDVQRRATKTALVSCLVTLALFSVAGVWIAHGIDGYRFTSVISPNGPSNPLLKTVVRESGLWLSNYSLWPITLIAPGLAFLGTLIVFLTAARRPLLAFIGNSLTIAGIIATAGVSMFPFLLPSSLDPNASLTVWDASSSQSTLLLMTIVTAVFMPIILAYTSWVYSVLRGKVTTAYIREQGGSLY
ncbi:MAG: cytochrome d ubiquinol oxidase subunit II [Alphaproteobacteria bacterium]